MKININYDFFERLQESKTGICLNKVAKRSSIITSISTSIILGTNMLLIDNINDMLLNTLLSIPRSFLIIFSTQYLAFRLLSKYNKFFATLDMQKLVILLNSIYVHTNYNLLCEAYLYDTEYSLNTEGKVPAIEQKKYIMVPVWEYGEEKEVSIVQEHILGTKEYTISCGSPRKSFKRVLQKAN